MAADVCSADALESGPLALIGSEASFAVLTEAWFDLLADGEEAGDCRSGGAHVAPPLHDLLSGVELSHGILGTLTPRRTGMEGAAPWQDPGCGLCRADWLSMMGAFREALGPSLLLRRAAGATGPRGGSLLGRLLLGVEASAASSSRVAAPQASTAAALMLLQASGFLGKPQEELHRCLREALPDGAAIAASPSLGVALAALDGASGVRLRRLPPAAPTGRGLASAPPQRVLLAPLADEAPSAGGPRRPAPSSAQAPSVLPDVVRRPSSSSSSPAGGSSGRGAPVSAVRLPPLVAAPPVAPPSRRSPVSSPEAQAARNPGRPAKCACGSPGRAGAEGLRPDAIASSTPPEQPQGGCGEVQAGGSPARSDAELGGVAAVAAQEAGLEGAGEEEEPLAFLAGFMAVDPVGRIGLDDPGCSLVEASRVRPRCCICLEDMPTEQLRHCGRADCGESGYCLACLRQHAETVVAGGLYAAPCVRCPSCRRRLATRSWSSLVPEALATRYRRNAEALLTFRCAGCDETGSFFTDASAPAPDPFAAQDIEVRRRIHAAWRRFALAEDSAEAFVDLVLREYGRGDRQGGAPPSKLSRIFGASGHAPWIEDLERRLAVQLAWMHRFPRQRTPCCRGRFCFRCKISTWHRGVACRDRLQAEKAKEAQVCPGCGVPTVRSEGCLKMNCVCGREWEWSENDDDDDDDSSEEERSLGDFASEEDEEMELQTPLNLVALSSKASEESVRTMVEALVNARADVNSSVADAPLLVAIRARHTAAVSALCAQGAKVTPEILDELKTVSCTASRHSIEDILRPQVQGDPNMKLPLWVWVQQGCATAVEALLRSASHDEEIKEDVLIALQRSHGSEESRQQMASLLRERVGDERFAELTKAAATQRLIQELRQAYDEEREVDVEMVREALATGAEPNTREDADGEEVEAEVQENRPTCLALLAMNPCRAAEASVASAITLLLEARADVDAEAEEASPLLMALQSRNVQAVQALCAGEPSFAPELLDEVQTCSEPTRRKRLEEALRPILRGAAKGGSRRFPLWLWVQAGAAQAVEALVDAAPEGEQPIDTDALLALQRCSGSEASRQRIEVVLRQRLGDDEFKRLDAEAATQRLSQELREADLDHRSPSLELVRDALARGADADVVVHGDEAEDPAEAQTALKVAASNTHSAADVLRGVVESLIEARADVNRSGEITTRPLLTALQYRCVPGIEALAAGGATVTSDILEEFKSLSGLEVRSRVEDVLAPLIVKDRTLRCPLWLWIQLGNTAAVEALLRNASYVEDVMSEELLALQKCRAAEEIRARLTEHLQEYLGEEDFQRLDQLAATQRLLLELREALTDERQVDLDVVLETLARGANPNAREHFGSDDEEEEEEEEEEDEEEEEEEEDEADEEEDEEDTEATKVEAEASNDASKDGGEEAADECTALVAKEAVKGDEDGPGETNEDGGEAAESDSDTAVLGTGRAKEDDGQGFVAESEGEEDEPESEGEE